MISNETITRFLYCLAQANVPSTGPQVPVRAIVQSLLVIMEGEND